MKQPDNILPWHPVRRVLSNQWKYSASEIAYLLSQTFFFEVNISIYRNEQYGEDLLP